MDRCDRCLRPLAQGALRFAVRVQVCGDTGGAIVDPPAASSGDALAQALAQAEQASEEELMADVAEEFSYTLCPPCRAAYRTDPAGSANVRSWPGVPQ